MNSSFSNYQYGAYDPSNFVNQFVTNALNPTAQSPYAPNYTNPGQAVNQSAPSPVQQPTNNPQAVSTISGQNNTNSQSDPYASLKSDINNSYNSYFNQLDSIFSQTLPQQQSAQQGIVNSQYEQGVSDINTQEGQALSDLDITRGQAEQTQTKNLRSLAEDVRNSMRAGNVYLGTRGASDSSATNQYAYAIGKEANKNKSNLMANYQNVQKDIAHKEFLIKSTYSNEMKRLSSQRDQNLLSIQNWFSSQQLSLSQAKANGSLQRDADLRALSQAQLNLALQALSNHQNQYNTQVNALQSWALSRSSNIDQLKSNYEAIKPFLPSYQGFNIQPSTTQASPAPVGGFLQDNTKDNIFGGIGG